MKKNTKKPNKLHIVSGDQVMVLSGDDKGKKGKVLKVLVDSQRAIVEGINKVTKHTKPSAANPQGGREEKEAPVHISNLMLVDPKSGEPTKVGRKLDKDGKLKRYAKKTGEIIK